MMQMLYPSYGRSNEDYYDTAPIPRLSILSSPLVEMSALAEGNPLLEEGVCSPLHPLFDDNTTQSTQ